MYKLDEESAIRGCITALSIAISVGVVLIAAIVLYVVVFRL